MRHSKQTKLQRMAECKARYFDSIISIGVLKVEGVLEGRRNIVEQFSELE